MMCSWFLGRPWLKRSVGGAGSSGCLLFQLDVVTSDIPDCFFYLHPFSFWFFCVCRILQDLLKRRDDFRLVVTSATLDAEKFSSYFFDCPIFTIPGRTFPVEVTIWYVILRVSRVSSCVDCFVTVSGVKFICLKINQISQCGFVVFVVWRTRVFVWLIYSVIVFMDMNIWSTTSTRLHFVLGNCQKNVPSAGKCQKEVCWNIKVAADHREPCGNVAITNVCDWPPEFTNHCLGQNYFLKQGDSRRMHSEADAPCDNVAKNMAILFLVNHGTPGGLFWLIREDSPLFRRESTRYTHEPGVRVFLHYPS